MHYQKNHWRQIFNGVSVRPPATGRRAINTRSFKANINEAFKSYAHEVLSRSNARAQEQTIKAIRDLSHKNR